MKKISTVFFSLLLLGGGVMLSQTNTFPSSGNTGVGTTNPGEKLEVVGNTKVKGDLIVTDTTKLKGDVRIDGQLKLKYFNSTTTTADRLLGVNPNGKVIDNPSILNLSTYRISPLPGDSIIRLGNNTISVNGTRNYFYIDPALNNINTPDSIFKGIGLGRHCFSMGLNSVNVGFNSHGTGAYSVTLGGNLVAFAPYSMVIGQSASASSRIVNTIPNSLMLGFNSDRATIFVSPSAGPGTTGVVCIGTTTMPPGTQYKLAVAGTILSHEVEVITPAQWPDYVFEKEYPLMSLEDRGAYIKKHKHLPWMKSADELTKNGLAVSETFLALTKNIEELNLYIIQLEARINAMEKLISH